MKKSPLAIIIDDESLIRAVLKKILISLGYETKLYNSALDFPCIADPSAKHCILTESTPDILITDIKMPGMDGIEFMKAIKSKGCNIKKTAIMSAFWKNEHISIAEELNCKRFQKPFRVETIAQWVNSD